MNRTRSIVLLIAAFASPLAGSIAHAEQGAPATRLVRLVVEDAPENRRVPTLLRIARTLEEKEGVKEVTIDASRNTVRVRFEPAAVTLEEVLATLDESGFHGTRGTAPAVAGN